MELDEKKKESLWVKLLRLKYGCGFDDIPLVYKKVCASHAWKGICRTWNYVQNGMGWSLGNSSKNINFWTNNWLPTKIDLLSHALINIDDDYINFKVADFTVNGIGIGIFLENSSLLTFVVRLHVCFTLK